MKCSLLVCATIMIGFLVNVATSSNKASIIEPCKEEVTYSRGILERFISSSNWSEERLETGTTGLQVSQIELLTDDNYDNVCEDLNMLNAPGIAMKVGPNNDPKYDYVYYKAGNFYFVVIILAEPSDPNYISIGLSALIIYDENLNEIKGYLF